MIHGDFHALLREPTSEFVPYFWRVLTYASEKSVLPELLRYIPRDQLENFLLAFGGQKVRFPTWEHVAELARDALIMQLYDESKRNHGKMNSAAMKMRMTVEEFKARAEALNAVYPLPSDGQSDTPVANPRPDA